MGLKEHFKHLVVYRQHARTVGASEPTPGDFDGLPLFLVVAIIYNERNAFICAVVAAPCHASDGPGRGTKTIKSLKGMIADGCPA